MSDTNDTNDKSGNRAGGHTLSLKRPAIEQSRVKQNFAHGRTKTVVVESAIHHASILFFPCVP